MTDRANVLLVILDSVRAENTSLHGYERETTPFLEGFADRATWYRQARAPGIHSIASHVSMFTGAHVEEHRALHHTAQIDLEETVWRDLAAEGYATGLFTNNRIVSNASNLGEAFDHLYTPEYSLAKRLENTLGNPLVERTYFRIADTTARVSEGIQSGPAPLRAAASAAGSAADWIGGLTGGDDDGDGDGSDDGAGGFKTEYGGTFTDAFLEWEDQQDGPWAACINLMDAHSPYEPEPEFDKWGSEADREAQDSGMPSVRETLADRGWDRLAALEPLYDGTIRQADAVVRELIADLERRGALSETLVIVTSDHGEAFGEASRVDPDLRLREHKWGIHEVLTHVPLVVQYPGQETGRTVDEVVSLTDIPAVATDLDAAVGVEGGDASEDRDPFVTGGPVLASTFRLPESKVAKYRSVDGVERFVGPWRAVYETREDAVRTFASRGEDHVTADVEFNGDATVVSRDRHDRVTGAYGRLEASDVVTEETTEIDDDLEDQLEHLGYIR
ncbi:sulfatase [Halobacteriales archaeon SW_7_65_23]|nr:MAG: sulfatase [Halobacteriales archaeon SW_7_65_23]